MKNFVLLAGLSIFLLSCSTKEGVQRESFFNSGWLFSLEADGDASGMEYDDSAWRGLSLPHDWSVEFPFDSVNGEGCTAYLPGGTGWYRKHFQASPEEDEKLYILFDGVYNNSEYWINGTYLGAHPYGYSPFWFDLTPHLDPSGNNVLAVKVDRTRLADSRWYPGAGIYRDVKLIQTSKLHIPVWGTFITTPELSKESATVQLDIRVRNERDAAQDLVLQTRVLSPEGKLCAEVKSELSLEAGKEGAFVQDVKVTDPQRWGVETPHLYRAEVSILQDGIEVDRQETAFAIRSIRFDPDQGFFLNGENMKIKGVCLHMDGGLVGMAVPKGVWKRRLQVLRDGGCNAIRVSHHPASEEFLELCDEMGFLVQDEFFDEWNYPKDKRLNMYERHDDYLSRGYAEIFEDHAEADLKNTMLAHRNHPSIIQWSIGNEIEWTYPRNRKATGFFDNMNWDGNYFWSPPPFTTDKIRETYHALPALDHDIGSTAQMLAGWTRELDTSRPVVANCILPSASFETGYADALDVVGFSYRRVMYDYAKEHYPDKVVMGTENLPQWHEWKAVEERDFVSGTFLWTGIDYLGESHEQWPRKATASGLLNLAAFPKAGWHMYKTLWTDDPHIFIATNSLNDSPYRVDLSGKVVEKSEGAWEQALWMWHDMNEHWNYEPGEKVIVEVISNCPELELVQNGTSLGTKKLADFPDRIYKWAVDFKDGNLLARGSLDGKEVKQEVHTAAAPASLAVEVDRSSLAADGRDVAHVVVQVVDEKGIPVRHLEKEIRFSVDGPLKSLGVDNGWDCSTQPYQSEVVYTHLGKALCILQSTRESGPARIRVEAEGMKPQQIELETR